jgi:cation transport regulator
MPYKNNTDLPEDIKDKLPEHAKDIYREAYNSAYDQYVEGEGQDEGHAHAVAWSAVKNKYTKDEESGKWKEK